MQTQGPGRSLCSLHPQNWGSDEEAGPCSVLPVPPSDGSHRRVCGQGPLNPPRRGCLPPALGLWVYKYRGVVRGGWAKAQPDTTSPSFTVTFCQRPVGTGLLICWHTLL